MNCSRILLFVIAIVLSGNVYAQDMPIGQWQSHLPYNSAVSVATDGVQVYIGSRYGFYTLNISDDEVTKYSKVNGMSDLGIAKVAYDDFTGSVIIAYENSNIDIFKDGNFHNIPDLKLKTVTGNKNINQIHIESGLAYLSTDVGILVVDLDRNEIKETYTFSKNSETIAIKGLSTLGDRFYAATTLGVYHAPKNSATLQAFQQWTPIDSTRSFLATASNGTNVFVAKEDSLFIVEADTLRSVYHTADSSIVNLVKGISSIWVIEYNDSTFLGNAKELQQDDVFADTINFGGEVHEIYVAKDELRSIWVANISSGLQRRTLGGDPFGTNIPQGPSGVSSFDISANNKELIVAHGGYNDTYRPLNSTNGFSVYKDGEWERYALFEYAPFGDSVYDITNVIKGADGSIYAGSTQSGLFIIKPDGTYEYYKQNSVIDPSSTGDLLYRVSGLAFDNDGVFWMTVYGGDPNELVARTNDGQWYKFSIPVSRDPAHAAINLIVDDYNQKWFSAPGYGVVVFDDNHTPAVTSDDQYIQLRAGDGSGGLPNNTVFCMANDKDGAIWIGTADGIGIVNCPSEVISRQCEAEKRIVQFDQFAGYLFQNEQVRTIAVDGANRKWIGTNNGVWLVSESGDEIIERFNTENSPLPSDIIQKIKVDPATGDVYIGTERGLMSYKGTAIDGGKENSDLLVYPNPVPSGYSGTIAIKGFVENADVRITDVSGQLVYKTKALGGQAVWNGMDYTGRRPQSGVYLIFGTNKDGSETVKGKMVFME